MDHRVVLLAQENKNYLVGWPAGAKVPKLSEQSKQLVHHGTLKLIFQAQSRCKLLPTGSMTIDRNCRVLATTILFKLSIRAHPGHRSRYCVCSAKRAKRRCLFQN